MQVGSKHKRRERGREGGEPTWISRPPHFNHVESFSIKNCNFVALSNLPLCMSLGPNKFGELLQWDINTLQALMLLQKISFRIWIYDRYVGALKTRLTDVEEERGWFPSPMIFHFLETFIFNYLSNKITNRSPLLFSFSPLLPLFIVFHLFQ